MKTFFIGLSHIFNYLEENYDYEYLILNMVQDGTFYTLNHSLTQLKMRAWGVFLDFYHDANGIEDPLKLLKMTNY